VISITRIMLRQFVRYVVVGGLAFVVDFSVLFLLTEELGLHYLVSASIAFLLGIVTNYLLCIAWIFDYRALNNRAHEFALFFAIGIAGLLLNNLLMFILTEFLDCHYLLSKAGAAALILIFNFSLRRSLLFVNRKQLLGATR
jgi:putative flippase GtrA